MLTKKPKGATEKRRGGGAASLLWMLVGVILTLMIGLFLYLWNPLDMGVKTVEQEPSTVEPINAQQSQSNDYEFYELLPEQEITSIPDEAIVREEPEQGAAIELDPDVVVNVPPSQDNTDVIAQEYGISEQTALNPMQSQEQQSTPDDDEQQITIIEEEGTYDEPLDDTGSGDAGSNTNDANSAGANNKPANSNQSSAQASSASIQAAQPKQTYILQIKSFSNAEEADKRRARVLMAGVEARVVKTKQPNDQVLYQVVSAPMTSRQAVITAQQKLQNNGIDSLIVEQRR